MDLFRWRRTLLRALGPALLCAGLAGWGVYLLTADERPTYRSSALLATGIMAARDAAGGSYVRDVVINELEAIMNLARSQETREELSARLLADFLALDAPRPEVISERAYRDLRAELPEGLVARHAPGGRAAPAIYASIVAERDSLLRLGEASAEHALIELLYGGNALVGSEQLATLRVTRKGLSDILELSYATVDAAWCKHTLDRHLEVFLRSHRVAAERRRSGALDYFRRATDDARARLAEVEEELRRFATANKIINYYEQTRYIASVKNQVDQRFTEEAMKRAAADSMLTALEARLAERTDLIRLNNLVDDRRRRLGELSREQVRLEIMSPDSVAPATTARLTAIEAEMAGLRRNLATDVVGLQAVHNGTEGLELNRLLAEWLAASLDLEQARGRLGVLRERRVDFDRVYTRMAGLGSRLKQLEREGDVAEEDYLERLRALNAALQREHSSGTTTDVRLLDAPALPTKPEKSKRLILVAVGALLGGGLPVVMAIALMLLSRALLSFAEAQRRTSLPVAGGVARWGWLTRRLRGGSREPVAATTADLLWQNLTSAARTEPGAGPRVVAVVSLRPGAGKSYVAELLAARLAARGLRVCAVGTDGVGERGFRRADVLGAPDLAAGLTPAARLGFAEGDFDAYDVVFWELPAFGTGRLPVALARTCGEALLVHPAAAGWGEADAAALGQLREALGRTPSLALNGLALPVLLHEWGVSLRELRRWGRGVAGGTVTPVGTLAPSGTVSPPVPDPVFATAAGPRPEAESACAEEVAATPTPVAPAAAAQTPGQRPAVWLGKPAAFTLPEEPTTPARFPNEPGAAGQPGGVEDDWEAELLRE